MWFTVLRDIDIILEEEKSCSKIHECLPRRISYEGFPISTELCMKYEHEREVYISKCWYFANIKKVNLISIFYKNTTAIWSVRI
jgi:hypothetical protein